MGDWVRYKLDRQIDHLLVDEAQDTNAAQWEIIEQLVEEFFTGSSESRGAAPHPVHGRRLQAGDLRLPGHRSRSASSEAREEFKRRARRCRGGDDLFDLSAERARIPRPVDRRQLPLRPADPRRGRCGDRRASAWRDGARRAAAAAPCASSPIAPGRVELWPPFAIDDAGRESTRARSAGSACATAATPSAGRAHQAMVEEAPLLASTERPLTPGDILSWCAAAASSPR